MKCFYYLLLTCFLFSCAASGPDPVVKTLRQEILKRAESESGGETSNSDFLYC